MKTHNNTTFTDIEHQISTLLQPLKRGRNNWRGRTITLYEHPTDSNRIISDGVTFDRSMRVIADEPKSDWVRELEVAGDFVTN